MKKIKIPAKKVVIEYVVKKSRFIATIEPFSNQRDLKSFIKKKREEYIGCRHVVYAFFVNDDCSVSGLCDDGEPHRTAGRPVYEVLKGSGLTDVLLTVTRFFGGTKLGTGGLVSAYSRSAIEVLKKTIIIEKINKIRIILKLTYKNHEQIKKILIESGAVCISESFSTDIILKADIPVDNKKKIEEYIIDCSKGRISCHDIKYIESD